MCMVLKLINATMAKPGSTVLMDGIAYNVRSNEMSKTGKHGSMKCRMELISIIDDKKKVIVVPGDERFEVPLIEKKKAQVLSIQGDSVNVMDLESYETFDLPLPENLKGQIAEEKQIEYWDIEGKKIIGRVLS